jgi:hypothetical protein
MQLEMNENNGTMEEIRKVDPLFLILRNPNESDPIVETREGVSEIKVIFVYRWLFLTTARTLNL